MIYSNPAPSDPIDQGDLIGGCPVLRIETFTAGQVRSENLEVDWCRIVVLTQTCDLANEKAAAANVAEIFEAQQLVAQGLLKASDVKGPIRAGRVWGW